jgi:hypothetical protein
MTATLLPRERAARLPLRHGRAASRVPGEDPEDPRQPGGRWPPLQVGVARFELINSLRITPKHISLPSTRSAA